MEQKIKELKELNLLRSIALEFDYVPNKNKVQKVLTLYDYDKDEMFKLLQKYEDSSPYEITRLICKKIEEL